MSVEDHIAKFIPTLKARTGEAGVTWTEHHQRLAERVEPHVERRLSQMERGLRSDIKDEFADFDPKSESFGEEVRMSDGSTEIIVRGPTRGGGLFGDNWHGYYTDSGQEASFSPDGNWYESNWTGPIDTSKDP